MAPGQDRPDDVESGVVRAGLADTLAAPVEGEGWLPRGTTIGRYVVLEQVGAGAMGVVYAAYDLELDRKIALKLVRDPARGGARRLLQEAQALAKLSHPHVVTVYDVGSYGDQVFIAMEFVEGRTLRGWLAEETRSWRQVVDVYRRAGEGLAAAHAAGIVHRDFKPDNVLLDARGRVRVGDFGLALLDRGESGDRGERDKVQGAAGSAGGWQTATGMAVGTPAYMAPEQQAGGAPIDARADQFSFCVSLWEALHGERPFGGESESELAAAVARGEIREPPAGSGVPPRLRRAIQRGLARDPDRRYPDMDALLAELRRDPAAARRRAAIAGGAVLIGALAIAGVALMQRGDMPLCRSAAGRLEGAWDGARKQAIRAAFRRSGDSGASWAALEPVLDRHARSWVAMHTESCEATHVRGEQSAELLDLRTRCLESRLAELRALTDLFASADAATARGAPQAASSLASLEQCANADALRQAVPPPGDAAQRARTEQLRARLPRLKALILTGKIAEGTAQARAIAADAAALRYRPVEAEALVLLGTLLRIDDQIAEAEEIQYRAIAAAEAGRHAEASVDAWLELIAILTFHAERHQEALRLAGLARAAIERQGGSKDAEAVLEDHIGYIYLQMSRLDEAEPHLERGNALSREVWGPEDPHLASGFQHLAQLKQARGKHEEALGLYRRARELVEKAYGADHPNALLFRGDEGRALTHLNRRKEALALFEGGLPAMERASGAVSGDVLVYLAHIGSLRHEEKDHAGALAALERAVALSQKLYGPEHAQVARMHLALGRLLVDMKRTADAMAHFETAAATLRRVLSPGDPEAADPLEDIAHLHIETGRPALAVDLLERALAIRERHPDVPWGLAYTRYELARALQRSGRAGPRIEQLLRAARAGFAESEDQESVDMVVKWLEAPGMVEPPAD
ncbi:MAG TPA: serine/threonine-protein kinase [Kofleriaceae bacterium]|nr:serine/threonine-protein kinase [Kofleriaceae bacterium]